MRWGVSILSVLSLTWVANSQTSKPEASSTRDPATVVASMNKAWHAGLEKDQRAPVAQADDSEFLRRVTLDLTGRIPTIRQTREFLDSRDPDKRRKLVDELLASSQFGERFGVAWRLWLDPPEEGSKPKPDTLSPWLTRQLNQNRGWGDIVREMLVIDGPIRDNPAMTFLLANSENFRPKPEMVADSFSRFFMGVELRCAQCHNHPFADWKQSEFWGLAAFFARVHPSSFKGGNMVTLLESDMLPDGMKNDPNAKGASLSVPAMSGPASGTVIRARFPKEQELDGDKAMPYRPYIADWLVAKDNPYFAKATVNRFWFLMFGRGLVNPLDGFDAKNPPANPELLEVLAKDFAASNYDVKHLLRCICLSDAYQRTSRSEGQPKGDDPLVSRMAVKPLSPEMLYDSLAVLLLPEVDKNKFQKPMGMKPVSTDKPKPGTNEKPQTNDKPVKPETTDKPQKPTDKPMKPATGEQPQKPTDKPMKPATGEQPQKPTDKPTKPATGEQPQKPMPEKPQATKPTGEKPMGMKPPAGDQAGKLPVSREEFVKYFRARGGNIHAINSGIPQALRLLNDPALIREAPIVQRLMDQSIKRDQAIEELFLAAYSRRPTAQEATLFNGYLSKQPDDKTGFGGMLWILLNSSEFLLNH